MNDLKNYFLERITITPTRGGLCLINVLFLGCILLAVQYLNYASRHGGLGFALLEALGGGVFGTIATAPFYGKLSLSSNTKKN